MRFHAQAFLKREWTQTLCSTLTGNTDTSHFLGQTTWVVEISSKKRSPNKHRKENFIRQWHSFFKPAWSLMSNGAVNSVEKENYIP